MAAAAVDRFSHPPHSIHSDFKYSMNWECPATYRPNLCLCRESCSHQAQESTLEGDVARKLHTLSLRGSLNAFCN